ILRTLNSDWEGFQLAGILRQAAAESTVAKLRELEPDDLNADIAVEGGLPLRFKAGKDGRLSVRVTNRSNTVWPAFSDYCFLDCRVVALWCNAQTGAPLPYISSFTLPRNLSPGETTTVAGSLEVPPLVGSYEIRVYLLQVLGRDRGMRSRQAETKIP